MIFYLPSGFNVDDIDFCEDHFAISGYAGRNPARDKLNLHEFLPSA